MWTACALKTVKTTVIGFTEMAKRKHSSTETIGVPVLNYDQSPSFTYREAIERMERGQGMRMKMNHDLDNPGFYKIWAFPDDANDRWQHPRSTFRDTHVTTLEDGSWPETLDY